MARLACLLLVVACGVSEEAGRGDSSAHEGRGQIVAHVDSATIGSDDVVEVMRATGLSSHEALSRLVAEELLFEQAERRGYGRGADYARALKRARARALLEVAVEREVTPESIDDAAVRARFEQDKAKLARPESRHVVRLFVRKEQAPGIDAQAAAASALSRLSALPLDALASEVKDIAAEAQVANIVMSWDERDRVRSAGGGVVGQAIDGVQQPGLVPRVVDTEASYVVVAVTDVQRAREAVYEEEAEALRQLLVTEARARRTQALLQSLAEKTPAQYDEQATARALADDSLLGTMP